MIKPTSCAACPVRATSFCGCLNDDDLSELSGFGHRRRMRRGETLCWAGDDSRLCANVLTGMLKIVALTSDGREQTVGFHYPAEFVGQLYSSKASFSVTAINDVDLCVFPRESFQRLVETSKDLEQNILRQMFTALDQARTRILTIARQSAEAKVAALILEAADRRADISAQQGQGESFDLPFTRGEMAEVLGLTIETVSRQMTQLKTAGIVRLSGSRTVDITDRTALECRAAL